MGTSFPHDWYIPPSSPGSGMHTWTGATVAPRHDEMTNGMNVEWEILQEKHRKNMEKPWWKPGFPEDVSHESSHSLRQSHKKC